VIADIVTNLQISVIRVHQWCGFAFPMTAIPAMSRDFGDLATLVLSA